MLPSWRTSSPRTGSARALPISEAPRCRRSLDAGLLALQWRRRGRHQVLAARPDRCFQREQTAHHLVVGREEFRTVGEVQLGVTPLMVGGRLFVTAGTRRDAVVLPPVANFRNAVHCGNCSLCSSRASLLLGRRFQDEVIIVAVCWYLTYLLSWQQAYQTRRDPAISIAPSTVIR